MKKGRLPPRVVLVTRQLPYERLLVEHGTPQQAEFFLHSRGQGLEPLRDQAVAFEQVRRVVRRQVPPKWRFVDVRRELLDRFLFEPEDLVIALGQDGLVANVAKYLKGQPVIGVNPDPQRYDGVLVRHPPEAVADLLATTEGGKAQAERRTMVAARLDDGQRLLALNEVFVGHRTHQSARYRISCGDRTERHSSSGVIVATGTGATGWARSIVRERDAEIALPAIDAAALVFLVREAFPSRATGTDITEGLFSPPDSLQFESEIDGGGVVFGDGIEDDFLRFDFGRRLEVSVADRRLELVVG